MKIELDEWHSQHEISPRSIAIVTSSASFHNASRLIADNNSGRVLIDFFIKLAVRGQENNADINQFYAFDKMTILPVTVFVHEFIITLYCIIMRVYYYSL